MLEKQSNKTKLAESLKELSKQKPIDKITVSDIAKNCGVSRKTFYNTFLDKYDLIEWIYFENCSKIVDVYMQRSLATTSIKIFKYLRENIGFYRNLAKKREENLYQVIYKVAYELMSKHIIELTNRDSLSEKDAFQLSCYIHGSITKAVEWINCPNRMSEEAIGRYCVLACPLGLAKYFHVESANITGNISFPAQDLMELSSRSYR